MTEGEGQQPVIAVDLFCGAGGFSEGLAEACDRIGRDLRLAAINHWQAAVETHERNHPDARQYHSKVEQLHPPEVVDELVAEDVVDVHDAGVTVDLLVAGPECTHFSTARGGKPVNEQKRMSPWQVLDWLEKLDVEAFIIENVGEIQSWGPVEDGEPTRDGTVFDAWINALNQLGYSVEWTTLDASHYGDPTSRERFFLVGRQGGRASFPAPTHSDGDDELPDRRTAAEIIDWSDLGTSIWTRDLTEPRVNSPPKHSTMQRIAEGIRRHCDDRLEPFAAVLEELGRDDIRELRETRVVPAEAADLVADAADQPFLVAVPPAVERSTPTYLVGQHNSSTPRSVHDHPLPTVTTTSRGVGVSTPQTILLRQQDGGPPWSVSDRPVPTVPAGGAHAIATPALVMPKNGSRRGLHSNPLYPAASKPCHTITADPRAKLVAPSLVRWSHGGATLGVGEPMPTIATERGGVYSLSEPYLCPLYNSRERQAPRTRAIDRPLGTVPASKSPAALTTPLARPFVDDCQGPPQTLREPLKTQPASDRYALCVPELWPWGLDVRYRMLQPHELKQAQGFPPDYEIVGTKADRTEQIGNAVPVNLARALCEHLLVAEDPSLATYGGGIKREPDAEVPDYQEVVSDD